MYDVRTLLTDEDYAKLAEILSLRGFDISSAEEAKAVIKNTQSGEVLKVTRYYIALKQFSQEVLKRIVTRGSSVGASNFRYGVDHAKQNNRESVHLYDRYGQLGYHGSTPEIGGLFRTLTGN